MLIGGSECCTRCGRIVVPVAPLAILDPKAVHAEPHGGATGGQVTGLPDSRNSVFERADTVCRSWRDEEVLHLSELRGSSTPSEVPPGTKHDDAVVLERPAGALGRRRSRVGPRQDIQDVTDLNCRCREELGGEGRVQGDGRRCSWRGRDEPLSSMNNMFEPTMFLEFDDRQTGLGRFSQCLGERDLGDRRPELVEAEPGWTGPLYAAFGCLRIAGHIVDIDGGSYLARQTADEGSREPFGSEKHLLGGLADVDGPSLWQVRSS